MTYYYRTGRHDYWSASIILILRTPLLRYTALCLLVTLFVAFCASYLLRDGKTIVGALIQSATIIALTLVVCIVGGRALISRVQKFSKQPELQIVTVGSDGVEIQAPGFEASHSWETVSEVVITRNYTYIIMFGMSVYPFERAGFESPDVASKFCKEVASFITPSRLVLIGNAKAT